MKYQRIEAGQIINTHGVNGEVKIEVWLDSPSFMRKFRRFFIRDREMNVISSRIQKNFLLVKLEGIDNLNAAMSLKGAIVLIEREDAELSPGEYFLCELIGARVLDETGRELGILKEIEELPKGFLYIVAGETEHLIPAVPEFIKSVDAEQGVLTVSLIEGM